MTGWVEDRLRVLALGIRPTFAVACGVEPEGTVDILDANGITGWQIGIRQLMHEAETATSRCSQLLDWMRAELRADIERWRYLAAFVTVLTMAVFEQGADAHDSAGTFWPGWRRNFSYARQQLASPGLVVSASSVESLHAATALLRSSPGTDDLPDLLARLEMDASVHVEVGAGEPPQLVLPEYTEVLCASLAGGPRSSDWS